MADLLQRIALAGVAWYLRHTPIEAARWRLVRRWLPLLRSRGAAWGQRTVGTHHGFRMRVDLRDWLGQYVYLTGAYERPTAHVLAALLRRGDTFVDVGANAGFFSLLAAQRVGPAGQVFAFEPVPAVWHALDENVRLNKARQITLYRIALADKPGVLPMHEGPLHHRGTSSLRPLNHASTVHQVEVRPLDDWLSLLRPVRLVKIDVEGAEQKVVAGMRRLIERDAPYLILEVTDGYLRAMGDSATSLCASLASLGYRMFSIEEKGLARIDDPPATWDPQFNALFCPGGQVPPTLRHMTIR